jgi:uncharacterized membrane protein YfcA
VTHLSSIMATIRPAGRFTDRSERQALGPLVGFAAGVLATFALLGLSPAMLPRDLVLPSASVLLLVLAGLFSLVAWSRGRRAERAAQVTYWDVAGALAFIGICAGALVDPDQMVRLVEGARRQP